MLYISRPINYGIFGVVDTDDGVEDRVMYKELVEMVIDYHLDIVGVTVDHEHNTIEAIDVYQDEKYCTKEQAKLAAISGVYIKTYKNEITSLSVDGHAAQKVVRVRLSDYGKSMAGCASFGWVNRESGKLIVFVLDDSFEIVRTPLRVFSYSDLRWDISTVSDCDYIEEIYKALIDTDNMGYLNWNKYLIDKPERMQYWRCIHMVNGSSEVINNHKSVFNEIKDFNAISAKIGELYERDFNNIASKPLNAYHFLPVYINDIINLVRKYIDEDGNFVLSGNFVALREEFISVFKWLRIATQLPYPKVRRFENYITWLNPPENIQKMYIKMCDNFVAAVRAYCKDKKIYL